MVKSAEIGHYTKKVEPLHCAKFRLNRSNPDRHTAIFIIQDGGRQLYYMYNDALSKKTK